MKTIAAPAGHIVPSPLWNLLQDRVHGFSDRTQINVDVALEQVDVELQQVNLRIELFSESLFDFTLNTFSCCSPLVFESITSEDSSICIIDLDDPILRVYLLESLRDSHLAALAETREYLRSAKLLLTRLLALEQKCFNTPEQSHRSSVSVRFFHHRRAPPGPTNSLFLVDSNNNAMTVLFWERTDAEDKETITNSTFEGRYRQSPRGGLPGSRNTSKDLRTTEVRTSCSRFPLWVDKKLVRRLTSENQILTSSLFDQQTPCC